MTPKLYSLKLHDAFVKAVHGGPVYLVSVSRSGRSTRWSKDLARALKVTASRRDALQRMHDHMGGRWVRAK